MTKRKAEELLEFKRKIDLLLADGIRDMFNMDKDSKLPADAFYFMSGSIMNLAEKYFKDSYD